MVERDINRLKLVLVEKKNKNGVTEQNISPMIQKLTVERREDVLVIRALVCCQNPTLNPSQLVAAIEKYLPELTPDFTRISRKEIYSTDNEIFR